MVIQEPLKSPVRNYFTPWKLQHFWGAQLTEHYVTFDVQDKRKVDLAAMDAQLPLAYTVFPLPGKHGVGCAHGESMESRICKDHRTLVATHFPLGV